MIKKDAIQNLLEIKLYSIYTNEETFTMFIFFLVSNYANEQIPQHKKNHK